MLPRSHPDGIHIAFDDTRLGANAGLILPATLALHLGLPQLVDRRLDLRRPRPCLSVVSLDRALSTPIRCSSRRSRAAKPWSYSTARTASPA